MLKNTKNKISVMGFSNNNIPVYIFMAKMAASVLCENTS